VSTIAHRRGAARRATLGTTAAIAGLMTAGVSAAFIALLLNDQSCAVPDGMPSAKAQHAIPPMMLAAYQAAAVQFRLPWEILAGIGKEECDNGRDADPSCAIQPGATGPGVANSAGASGPMQIGVGGLAGDEYQTLRHYLPADQQDLGPHDPTVAVELAALVLIHDKGAPTGRPIDTYLPYVRAYNGTGPAADGYASRVIADAHQYEGGDTLAAVGVGCAAAQGTYVNPFSRATDLAAERIDMGVDYSGRGPILALGDAKITYATTDDPGWAYCGAAGAITLQLVDGPDEGRDIYITEGIAPTVAAGQTVTAGQPLADFAGAGCLEIGWSTIPNGVAPEAAALGQQAKGLNEDPGDNLTYCGNSMSELLASLGAPPGLRKGRAVVGDRC